MSRLPIAVGGAVFVTVTLASLLFVSSSAPIATSSAIMVFVGISAVVLGGLAGLLLVRAPWSRWLLGATIVASLVLASGSDTTLSWLSLVLGAMTIVALAGPWLTLWVRQQPAAEKLGIAPVMLITSGGVSPIVVGLTSWTGVGWIHWALVATTVVASWSYGRGLPFGIWLFRVCVPLVGLAAALMTVAPSAYALGGSVALLTATAWSPGSTKVTAVLTPPLPAPTRRRKSNNASN